MARGCSRLLLYSKPLAASYSLLLSDLHKKGQNEEFVFSKIERVSVSRSVRQSVQSQSQLTEEKEEKMTYGEIDDD